MAVRIHVVKLPRPLGRLVGRLFGALGHKAGRPR